MYVDRSTKYSFIRKEFFSRNYKRTVSESIFEQSIVLDEAIKNTIGICLNKEKNIYIIKWIKRANLLIVILNPSNVKH